MCILFMFIFILSGCDVVSKDKASVKSPVASEVYPNNTPQPNVQNNSNKINQDKNIKIESPKVQQIKLKTTFKQGDKGDKVKEIQQKLNKFGYKLNVDGDFSNATNNAVMDFQMRNKMLKDGIVGELTLKKLNMAPTSVTMYKLPVIQKAISKAAISKNTLEKFINSKNNYSFTSYFIWIDLAKQKVYVFNGSNKRWHLVKSMACSSGKTSTPTVKGNFTVGSKGGYFISNGGARCKYYTQISGNYLFHSVLYDKDGNYIIDNTLGVAVSHGCVRLALVNAKYIYDNIPAKTSIWSN